MATMAEVAARAGVSTTTVSHVLNGTRHVSEDARRRVEEAIEETGYSPNTIARSLATASTRTIGLAISAISNPYFIDLVHVIEAEFRSADFLILLADTKDDPDEELAVVRSLHSRRVDGLVLAPSGDPEQRALRYLRQQAVPTVLVDRFASTDFDQVGVENTDATTRLVRHLASLGHRRIAMVGGHPGLSTTTDRLAGYHRGLQQAGLTADPALVAAAAGEEAPARAAVHTLLALPDPPTAILAANNRMTIGVMQGLRDRGLEVPEDIALVAFDDFEWADLFRPRLTVVSQPIEEIGREVARLLLARLQDPDRAPSTAQFPATFVHRESCGCGVTAPPR